MGGWIDTDYLINGKTCIMESITDIQNLRSESMQRRYSNVDYDEVRM